MQSLLRRDLDNPCVSQKPYRLAQEPESFLLVRFPLGPLHGGEQTLPIEFISELEPVLRDILMVLFWLPEEPQKPPIGIMVVAHFDWVFAHLVDESYYASFTSL